MDEVNSIVQSKRKKTTGIRVNRSICMIPYGRNKLFTFVWVAKVMNSPVQLTMRSFLNPYSTQFIVVFNNVWLAASWQSCPHCIYFLSDAHPNNSVIPCGPTTQTAETPISLTSGPLPHPWRQWEPLSPPSSPHYILLLPMLHSLFLFTTILLIALLHLLRPHPLLSHIWEKLRI